MFFSQHFSFSHQYHSTNAPYSIIHLPPTIYNVYHPARQFPLSVSFHQCTSVSPVSITPPMLHTHSFIYHRHSIKFITHHIIFPCQYHSTNAPYPFTHLPQTLYKVFLPVLLFPLSVSFHKCSIHIHPFTTDTIMFLTQHVSLPVSIIRPMLHIHSFIYHRHSIRFITQHVIIPCQYHSTNAPHPFIHLPPTLYNVFLPARQFPLSVSFHQCPILIHSSNINAV